MVDQYDVDGYDADMLPSTYGDWVKYEDYAKLADLCGRMATLLRCTPATILDAGQKQKAIAEAEEVLK